MDSLLVRQKLEAPGSSMQTDSWRQNLARHLHRLTAAVLTLSLRSRSPHAATTLCALHFLACSLSICVVQLLGWADRKPLPSGGKVKGVQCLNSRVAVIACQHTAHNNALTGACLNCCCLPCHLPAAVLLFALVANLSIASLNLSLLVNSVSIYQVRPRVMGQVSCSVSRCTAAATALDMRECVCSGAMILQTYVPPCCAVLCTV